MENNNRIRLLVVAAVVIGLVAFYRFYPRVPETTMPEEVAVTSELPPPPRAEVLADGTRRASAVTTYEVPDGSDHVRFSVIVDAEGTILGVALEEAETHVVSEHQKEFADELTHVIAGKKLSELTTLDKVGKSSLTTQAFNSVIAELQGQI